MKIIKTLCFFLLSFIYTFKHLYLKSLSHKSVICYLFQDTRGELLAPKRNKGFKLAWNNAVFLIEPVGSVCIGFLRDKVNMAHHAGDQRAVITLGGECWTNLHCGSWFNFLLPVFCRGYILNKNQKPQCKMRFITHPPVLSRHADHRRGVMSHIYCPSLHRMKKNWVNLRIMKQKEVLGQRFIGLYTSKSILNPNVVNTQELKNLPFGRTTQNFSVL